MDSKKIYEIDASFAKGDIGEQFCHYYFSNKGCNVKYIDDKTEQATLGDFKVTKSGDTRINHIEVKTDYVDSENLFFETISNDKKGTLGCFLKTEADLWFYLRLKTNRITRVRKVELIILPLDATRDWFLNELIAGRLNGKRSDKTKTQGQTGNIQYGTKGFPINVDLVVNSVAGAKKYLITEEFNKFEAYKNKPVN
jgi:hypothetical protein